MNRLLLITFDSDRLYRGKMPDADVDQIMAAGDRIEAELRGLGLEVSNCKIDFGETAEATLTQTLEDGTFDCVMIGAGIRVNPEHTVLFEMLVNVVHRDAPNAKFAFGATRDDTPAAVKRVMGLA